MQETPANNLNSFRAKMVPQTTKGTRASCRWVVTWVGAALVGVALLQTMLKVRSEAASMTAMPVPVMPLHLIHGCLFN